MPQAGFLCPGGINPNDDTLSPKITFESNYCINDCKHQCMPASVLIHIQSKMQQDKHKGFYISVTSLLGCLRQLYFERTIDYYVEPSRNWYSLRGAILHALLENPGLEAIIEDLIKEVHRRVEDCGADQKKVDRILNRALKALNELSTLLPRKEIPNWVAETEYEYNTGLHVCSDGTICDCSNSSCISNGEILWLRGTIDVLRPETGEIYDYKTIGDKGIGIIKDGAKQDHIMQFNLYRLLVERGRPLGVVDYTPIQINKITAFYMTMMQVVKTGGLMSETTQWRQSEPTAHPNLIEAPVEIVSKIEQRPKRGKTYQSLNPDDFTLINNRKFKLTYAIPEVPLLDLDKCADFVKTQVPKLYLGFTQGIVPEMTSVENRQWMCSYCPEEIKASCDAKNDLDGVEREVLIKDYEEIPIESI